MKKVIVIGAGIIGSSAAYYLAKSGAQVLVLEAGAAGGIATPNSWSWINASWGNAPDYAKFRMTAMAQWRSMASLHPALAVDWCGGLLWDLPENELITFAQQRVAMGYDIHLVEGSTAVQKIEPRLAYAPKLAIFAKGEGAIEPRSAAQTMLKLAVGQGAQFSAHATVSGFKVHGGHIVGVYCNSQLYEADEIVLAAGVQTADLLKFLNLEFEMTSPAGLLVHSKIHQPVLNGLVMAPELHVRQTADGRLVAGSDFGGAEPLQHADEVAKQLFATMKQHLTGLENVEMEHFTVGHRPTPSDGLPAIGRPSKLTGIYVMVTHSGMTLAPLLGKCAADEIVYDKRDAIPKVFHPDRLCT
jgi:glycine/D-amino acid oxidase-like deaminating enzyme